MWMTTPVAVRTWKMLQTVIGLLDVSLIIQQVQDIIINTINPHMLSCNVLRYML